MFEQPKPFERKWNRSGLSEQEWSGITPPERVVHYNRNLPRNCKHSVNILDWPIDLVESYSHDPYFHTAHLAPCERKTNPNCKCETCVAGIGIPR
jgi:hypothetical protein